MYEEDRLRALDLYNSIFEDVGNDTEVLQLLVSPTRQAVNLARSYDAKERKLQVHTQSRGEAADGEEPAFIQVIEELRAQAETLGIAVPRTNDDQISLFEEPDVAETVFDDIDLAAEAEAVETDGEELLPPEEMHDAISLFPDEDRADVIPVPAPAEPAAPQESPAEAAPQEAPAEEVEEFSDAVDAFLADFSIKDDELAPEAEAPAHVHDAPTADFPADEEAAAREAAAPQPKLQPQPAAFVMDKPAAPETQAPAEKAPADQPVPPAELAESAPAKKANVPLLILFILFAVPICLLLIGLMLALAAAFLGLAAAGFWIGVSGFATAFTGFSVFADILLVLGAALVVAAVGLLCFWLFVRLIFSAIPGIIRGACALGRKWCYKEVEQA